MAISDYIDDLKAVIHAFTAPGKKPDLRTAVRQEIHRTQAHGEELRSAPGPAPPDVPGAGVWDTFKQPWLSINEQQQDLLGSKDARYGRFSSRAGPTPASFSTYAGSGLTLDRIAQIHREVDTTGYMVRKSDCDLAVLRRDAHIHAVDRARRSAVFQSPFRLKPADNTPEAQIVCDFVTQVIEDIDGFDSSAGELLLANAAGYSVQEIVRRPTRPLSIITGPGTRTVIDAETISSLEPVFNRHIRWDIVNDRAYLDMGGGGFVDPFCDESGHPLHKFILHRAVGDGYARQRGYMFSGVYLHILKHQSIARWGAVLETYGVPTPYLTMDDGDGFASDEDRRDAETALKDHGLGIPAVIKRKWGELRHAPIPQGVDARGMHAALWGAINTELSKLIAGSTLQFELGGVGSYNASETHAATGEATQRIDAKLSAATYRTQLLRAIVDLNAEELARVLGISPDQVRALVPRCYWVIDRKADSTARLKQFIDGAASGLEIDSDQVMDELDFRSPRPGGHALRPSMQQSSSESEPSED